MKRTSVTIVVIVLLLTLTNCAPKATVVPTTEVVVAPTDAPVVATSAPAASTCTTPFKVAWVYDGPIGDQGWVDAHEAGRQYVVDHLSCLETTTVESVAEGDAERVFNDLVAKGYQMIFATTFGFMDAAYTVAEAHPEVKFEHVFGYKMRDNMSIYSGRLYQVRYLTGIVAGMMTKKNEIGYLASFPIPEVISGINGFAMGVKAVNPDAKIHVVWLNTWYDPVVERQGAESLLDLGIDVLTFHAGSPASATAAEERGINLIGEYNMYKDAPNSALTMVQWNWGPYYLETVKAAQEGTWVSHDFFGGIDTGVPQLGPYTALVPQDVQDAVETAEQKILGGWDVFTGPITDNKGNIVVAEGETLDAEKILSMEWFVDNVIVPSE